jgi:hypothetical protein
VHQQHQATFLQASHSPFCCCCSCCCKVEGGGQSLHLLRNDIKKKERLVANTSASSAAPRMSADRTVGDNDASHQHLVHLREASRGRFNSSRELWPRKVYFRAILHDMANPDCANGTVSVEITVYLRWFDEGLVHADEKLNFRRTAEEYAQLWSPQLEVNDVCGVNVDEVWGPDTSWNLKSYETGEIKYSQRYRAVIKNFHDLRKFPFDSDEVVISLGPQFMRSDKFVLESDPDAQNASVLNAEGYPLLGEWSLDPKRANACAETGTHSRIVMRFHIYRNYQFYVYKVFMVNVLATTWSWSVFFEEPTNMEARMNTTLTLFLASVAFLFVVNDKLPKIPYLTVMDQLMGLTFVFLFCTGLESLGAYLLATDGRWFSYGDAAAADTLDQLAVVAFPSVYIMLNFCLIAGALWHRRRPRARVRRPILPRTAKVDSLASPS